MNVGEGQKKKETVMGQTEQPKKWREREWWGRVMVEQKSVLKNLNTKKKPDMNDIQAKKKKGAGRHEGLEREREQSMKYNRSGQFYN